MVREHSDFGGARPFFSPVPLKALICRSTALGQDTKNFQIPFDATVILKSCLAEGPVLQEEELPLEQLATLRGLECEMVRWLPG